MLFVFTIVTLVLLTNNDINTFEIFGVCTCICWIILSITYILSFNYQIMKMVAKTFDFSYKLFNVCMPMIFVWMTHSKLGLPIGFNLLVVTTMLCVSYLSLMVDAAYWSNKIKLATLFGAALTFMSFGMVLFFMFEDINVNIANFIINGNNYKVNISLKSLLLSNWSSFAMFTMKPAYAIYKAMKKQRKIKNTTKSNANPGMHDNNIDSNSSQHMLKSSSINNRPYFKWINTEVFGE